MRAAAAAVTLPGSVPLEMRGALWAHKHAERTAAQRNGEKNKTPAELPASTCWDVNPTGLYWAAECFWRLSGG